MEFGLSSITEPVLGAVGNYGSSALSSGSTGLGNALGGWAAELLGLNDSTREANLEYQQQLLAQQYAYYIQGLKESPSAYRQGLEEAGYNPILAVNSGASAGSFHGSGGANPQLDRSGSGGSTAAMTNKILASEASSAESRAKIDSYGVPAARAESAARQAEAEQRALIADAYNEAVSGIVNIDRHNAEAFGYVDLVEGFRNEATRDRYLKSLEHQVYEDIREGVSSASEATRAGASLKSAFKFIPESTEKHIYHYNRRH